MVAAAKHGKTLPLLGPVGDAVIFPTPKNSVVNGLQHAERQASGRAFAAELLAPIDEIVGIAEKESDERVIADEFDVSKSVISYQLENHERRAWSSPAKPYGTSD